MDAKKPIRPQFQRSGDFYKVLKKRVSESLRNSRQRDQLAHYFKGLVVTCWALGAYASLYYVDSFLLLIPLCALAGVGHTALGFNLFHDSIHGSLSRHKWINRTVAFLSCSVLGVSHYMWRHKHNYLHHQFTNIQDWDDDLETREALRLSPEQLPAPRYRYQHIYAPFIYAMTSLEWVFVKDYRQYFSLQMNSHQKIPRLRGHEHLEFWVSKLIHFSLYVVLPFSYFSLPVFLVGLLIFHFAKSLAMASIFQLAHVMPDGSFPKCDSETGELAYDWAHLQLETTVNFGINNRFLTWFAGGLNYQIEHHLFPKVSHIHYPAISQIVQQTAKEFELPYYCLPTYRAALKGHFQTLRELALEPVVVAPGHHHILSPDNKR